MKTALSLITAAAGLSLVGGIQAGEPILSPKAAQLSHQLRTVTGTTPDLLERNVKAGSPKAVALAHDFRKAPGKTPDMLVRKLPTASPGILRNEPWRLQPIQVAPLK
ncbi:MAG: hypothetical protein HY735_03155 [Verrucomicrobia bacterium]|nr:hypothetical protein [Verrucomicrobiota bacterium]